MVNKTALTIVVSIILTILIISLVNVGLSLFLEGSNYEDFCGRYIPIPGIENTERTPTNLICSQDVKTCADGSTLSRDPKMGCEFFPCSSNFKDCQEEYQSYLKDYNQVRYYVFASVGFILLLLGLFSGFSMIQLTGLASGGILLTEGIVLNFQNKTIVFTSLLFVFVIFGLIAWRIVNKK